MIIHEFKTKEYHYSLYSYLDDKETCYIANVEVYQEYRGKGYGNELLLDILDKVKEHGYKNIILKCFRNSWKYLWYQRHGFRFYCTDNDAVLEYKISIDKNIGKIRRRRVFAFIGDSIIEIDHDAFREILISDYLKANHDSLRFNCIQYTVVTDHAKNAWKSGNYELRSYYNLLMNEFLTWKLDTSETGISW